MARKRGWAIPVAIVLVLFVAGVVAGYLVSRRAAENRAAQLEAPQQATAPTKLVTITFALANGLYPEQVGIRPAAASSEALASAVVREFLHGPSDSGLKSAVPEGSPLLGVYLGQDGILYVNLSNDFIANFRGDALSEFMVLKGLYKSVLDNVGGIAGIRILAAGREAKTIGGHIVLDALTTGTLMGDYNAPR